MGEWLARYGDSIYGTRGGPIAPADWGVTTQKEIKIYVHVLNWAAPLLALPPVQGKVVAAHVLLDNQSMDFTQNADGLVLKVPSPTRDETDRVIVLSLANN